MANVTNGDVVLATFKGTLFQQTIMSLFCYRIQSLTGTPSITTWATAFRAALIAGGGLKSKYLACVNEQYTLDEIWVQIISPTRYAADKFVQGEIGLFEGTCLSANQAAVITRRGDYANRSNVSTLHVPIGQSASDQADGLITQTLKDKLQDLADQMKLSVTTAGTVSTSVPIIPDVTVPPAPVYITKTFVMDTVRVMRRRTVGLGI